MLLRVLKKKAITSKGGFTDGLKKMTFMKEIPAKEKHMRREMGAQNPRTCARKSNKCKVGVQSKLCAIWLSLAEDGNR